MSAGVTTIGVKVKWAVEATAGTKPTTNYTALPGLASFPGVDEAPETIESTTTDDEAKTFEPGLQNVGSDIAIAFNGTDTFDTAWEAVVTANTTAQPDGKYIWLCVEFPNKANAYYISGRPRALSITGFGVGENYKQTAHFTPGGTTTSWGWAAKPAS